MEIRRNFSWPADYIQFKAMRSGKKEEGAADRFS